MISEADISTGAAIPGAGPTPRTGQPIATPILATSADTQVLGGDRWLVGWSLRESTGINGAVIELYDGYDTTGVLLGTISLDAGGVGSNAQTPEAQSSSGANTALTPNLPATAGQTAFVTSLRITGTGATAGATVTATLTGVLGGTISYPIAVPTGVAVPITPIFDSFGTRGLQASGSFTAITLTVPAFGAGNTLEEAQLQGYILSAGGSSATAWFGDPGLFVRSGLFLHLVTGSVKGTVYARL